MTAGFWKGLACALLIVLLPGPGFWFGVLVGGGLAALAVVVLVRRLGGETGGVRATVSGTPKTDGVAEPGGFATRSERVSDGSGGSDEARGGEAA